MSGWDKSRRAKELRHKNPFGDFDKDRVINISDCQPCNPDEQDIKEWAGRHVIQPAKKHIVKPVEHAVEQHIEQPAGRAIEKVHHKLSQPVIPPKQAQRIGHGITRGMAYEARRKTAWAPKVKKRVEKLSEQYHRKVVRPYSTKLAGFVGGNYAQRHKKLEQVQKRGREYKQQREQLEKGGLTKQEKEELTRTFNKYKKQKAQYEKIPTAPYHAQSVKGVSERLLSVPIIGVQLGGYIGKRFIEKPQTMTKIPSDIRKFGKGYYSMAKKEPARAAGQLAAMWALSGFRVPKRVKVAAGRLSPRYISPEEVTTTTELMPEIPSTRRMPIETTAEAMKAEIESPTYKLTETPEEVWHGAPVRFKPTLRGEVEIQPGSSPTKGLYVGAEAYPKFTGLTKIEVPRRVPTEATEPTFYSIKTKGVRVPKRAPVTAEEMTEAGKAIGGRAETPEALTRFAGYKKYVEEVAPKEYAYTSPEVTAKIPWKGELEVESVIPQESVFKEPLRSRLMPRYTYIKAPKLKFTRSGGKIYRDFYGEWNKRIKEAPTEAERAKLAREFGEEEPKLLNELKRKGELRQKGYEPQKVKVRRLTPKDVEEATGVKTEKTFKRPGVGERFRRIPETEAGELRRGNVRFTRRTPSERIAPAFRLPQYGRERRGRPRRAEVRIPDLRRGVGRGRPTTGRRGQGRGRQTPPARRPPPITPPYHPPGTLPYYPLLKKRKPPIKSKGRAKKKKHKKKSREIERGKYFRVSPAMTPSEVIENLIGR